LKQQNDELSQANQKSEEDKKLSNETQQKEISKLQQKLTSKTNECQTLRGNLDDNKETIDNNKSANAKL